MKTKICSKQIAIPANEVISVQVQADKEKNENLNTMRRTLASLEQYRYKPTTVEEFVNAEKELDLRGPLTDDEIVAIVTNHGLIDIDDSEDQGEKVQEVQKRVSYEEAKSSLMTAFQYFSSSSVWDIGMFEIGEKLFKKLEEANFDNKRQTNLDCFLKKG
jgi:hypothetical protein